jgi:hypothetical protein
MSQPSRSGPQPPDEWSPNWRSVVSVLLVMHFTCVFVVLSSNNRRSPLQQRLVRVFGFYTQLLNFDPNSAPYVMAAGDPTDDAVFEIELYAKNAPISDRNPLLNTVTLPDRGSKLLDQQKRYFSLAREVVMAADPQAPADETSGEIAKAVGARIMAEQDPPCKRAVVRCIRRAAQPLNLDNLLPGFDRNNPADRSYDRVVYEADVFLDEESNSVQAIKRSGRNEVAPRQTGGS